MYAKGPMPGVSDRADAMAILPPGVRCVRDRYLKCFVILLANGRTIAEGRNPNEAWKAAARLAQTKK